MSLVACFGPSASLVEYRNAESKRRRPVRSGHGSCTPAHFSPANRFCLLKRGEGGQCRLGPPVQVGVVGTETIPARPRPRIVESHSGVVGAQEPASRPLDPVPPPTLPGPRPAAPAPAAAGEPHPAGGGGRGAALEYARRGDRGVIGEIPRRQQPLRRRWRV